MRLGLLQGDRAFSRRARRHPAGSLARGAAKLFSPWPATAQGLAAAAVMRASGKPAGGVALAPGAAVAAAELLKRATHRFRPGMHRFLDGGRRSFPSSHVAAPAALVAAAWFDAPPRARVALAAGLGAVVAAIALERLEAGAHWPSDVLAGALLGIGVGAVLGTVARRREGVRG